MAVLGFLNIDKPAGMTSHDVVARIRRGLKLKKAGHAGTLDPMATGVLVICLGAATRLSEYVMHSTKRYRAQVCLGIVTDTYDAEGQVLAHHDTAGVTREAVENALAGFVGQIEQLPPAYSAIKRGGRKLYELARAGQSVELVARPVRIDSLALVDWSPPYATLDVQCSAGTYIRSLAYDLGQALGVGAHLSGLVRTASGSFMLENAVALDTILTSADWKRYVVAPQAALADWPVVRLDDEALAHVAHGRAITHCADAPGELAQAQDSSGRLVAVLRRDGDRWLPHKVFVNQG
jgi:tRNA pseudouridine55 synthase